MVAVDPLEPDPPWKGKKADRLTSWKRFGKEDHRGLY